MKRLLVLLPALNEEKTLGEVIRSMPSSVPGIREFEVVVIDDGSSDGTASVGAEAGATVLSHHRTEGVGAAFQTGLFYAIQHGADLVVSMDADGQFNPEDIPRLIEPVQSGAYDFSTASRFKDTALIPDMPRVKLWGNRVMSRLISRLAGQRFFDVSCGMRCYNREAILRLHLLARFTYTQEVILNLSFKGLRLAEVPVRVRGVREHGRSRVASSLWRYALKTVQIILRSYRDHRPLQFFLGAAGILLTLASALGVFLAVHYVQTGAFTPHKWAGVASGVLIVVAVLMGHMGLVGDMLNRHRLYLEEILYRQRSASDLDGA